MGRFMIAYDMHAQQLVKNADECRVTVVVSLVVSE